MSASPANGSVEPRWLDSEEQCAWRAFLTAFQLVQHNLARQMQREGGMPYPYYEILVHLSEAPDWSLRMSELAQVTGYSPSRLSHAVARLEEWGWVCRTDCPTDKRGQFAGLTEDGFAALAAAAPGHIEAVRRLVFDPLSSEQVQQLREISEALIGRATAEPEEHAEPTE